MDMSRYVIETGGRLQPHLGREWLLTNGIGGYAASTIPGCNARKYHGLLIAATLPPVGRIMTLSRIGEILTIDHGDTPTTHEFSVNQFGSDQFHPHGWQYLQRFELGLTARWAYDVAGVQVDKELQLPWMSNIVGVRYRIRAGGRKVTLRLLPFVALRDFHAVRRRGETMFHVEHSADRAIVRDGPHQAVIAAEGGQFIPAGDWWFHHHYTIEAERGQDCTEDLFTPGAFVIQTEGEAQITLWAGVEGDPIRDWEEELARREEALWPVPEGASPALTRLIRAAQDFVVRRRTPDGSAGASILAGYPWFADWGRDTMIALPGLLLSTGRFEQARQVLSVFGHYVSEGMIPNRFDDYTDEPSYNTVDASLWFIHACFEYLHASGDRDTFEQVLRPACQAIIDGYRKGTRFGIRMDEADGLITQGDASTQLTWMDAKTGGIAFTPRQGKAVEINALWYNALMLMGHADLASRVAESFRAQFWISPFRGLYDVVDGDRRDGAIRPNQIIAVSLPHSPLTVDQQRAVVEVVRRELLTPRGLRSLAAGDVNYHGRYAGPQMERDRAYHNGTVWGWLIGPFLEAYLRVNDFSDAARQQARQWLQPLLEHMDTEACIGQISEIFEGDPPHCAVGCFAQAWSVAEVLRVLMLCEHGPQPPRSTG